MQLVMDLKSLTAAIKAAAADLGFATSGICPAATPTGLSRFQTWLERGYDGQMTYLRERSAAYEHPGSVLEGVRSIVVLTLPYLTDTPQGASPGYGRVSRYAWNASDYHDVIHDRLRQLGDRLRQWRPGSRTRGVVDTAPLLERDLAQRAGLGWIAKNTMLIDKAIGSWFFLAALLTDQELVHDQPHEADHCGTCRACLDACPTQAFPEPYVLDAQRCISYLTIELRDAVPGPLRPLVGDWAFGCDVCQEVCPWNRKALPGDADVFSPVAGLDPIELLGLFEMTDAEFRERFRSTALWRTRRRGLLRNAAIVLGNQRYQAAVEPLGRGLQDAEPVIRGACAWALGRIGGPAATDSLARRLADESNDDVRGELQQALAAAMSEYNTGQNLESGM
jgi:epoxyqueuosine reductase